MDCRLFAAAHAGAISAHHRHVVFLLEKERRQHADSVLEIPDVDVPVIGIREPLPHVPVAPELLHRVIVLLDGDERFVGANIHTEVAALACLRVDRDGQQSSRSLLLAFGQVEERCRLRQREVCECRINRCELRIESGSALGVHPQLVDHGLVRLGQHVGKGGERHAFHDATSFLREMLGNLAQAIKRLPIGRCGRDRRVDHFVDRVYQARYGGVRTLRPALCAPRAVGRNEFRYLEPYVGHVPNGAGRRRDGAHGGERICDAVLAALAEMAYLFPETPWVAYAGLDVRPVEMVGNRGYRRHFIPANRQRRNVYRLQIIVPAPDHADVVLHHPLAEITELCRELRPHAIE